MHINIYISHFVIDIKFQLQVTLCLDRNINQPEKSKEKELVPENGTNEKSNEVVEEETKNQNGNGEKAVENGKNKNESKFYSFVI